MQQAAVRPPYASALLQLTWSFTANRSGGLPQNSEKTYGGPAARSKSSAYPPCGESIGWGVRHVSYAQTTRSPARAHCCGAPTLRPCSALM
jgi:hypothetical protein